MQSIDRQALPSGRVGARARWQARLWLIGAVAALGALASGQARADVSGAERNAAQALFEQGRELMEARRYEAACPKLAESHRLDPAGGTVMNLGRCYEEAGRLASAWTTYKEALAFARKDKNEARAEYAEKRIALLEPRLSHVEIVLGSNGRLPGLVIELHGQELGAAAAGVPLPIDPGSHEVVVKAPGKLPWKTELRVKGEAQRVRLAVPPLVDAPQAPAPAPAPSTAPSAPPRPAGDAAAASLPLGPLLLGAVGVLAAGAGTYLTLSSRSDYNSVSCPKFPDGSVQCSEQDKKTLGDAEDMNQLGWIGVGVGAGALVGAMTWWALAPSGQETSTRAPLSAVVTPLDGGGFVGLAGRF